MEDMLYELIDIAGEHLLTEDGDWLLLQESPIEPGVAQFQNREDAELTRRILFGFGIHTRVHRTAWGSIP